MRTFSPTRPIEERLEVIMARPQAGPDFEAVSSLGRA
jgi:hypothetical protein